MQSINPATEQLIQSWSEHDQQQVDEIVASSAKAFARWRHVDLHDRRQLLSTLADLLRKQREQHAQLMTAEMGKPIREARAEIDKCAWTCDYYAENADSFLGAQTVNTDASQSQVEFAPLGIVLGVMPWNFPYWQVFRFIAPSLVAGNTCLLKHASAVCGCSQAIEDLVTEAGTSLKMDLPLLKALNISSSRVAAVIERPEVAAVTLTGSEEAGRSVAAIAGAALKKAVLELGGSDPFVVLADADLEQAADIAVLSRSINAGQSCIAAKRFIVEQSVYGQFADLLVQRFAQLRVGDPCAEDTDMGPLARPEFVDQLQGQVDRSVAIGAQVALAGGPTETTGWYFKPTVLTEVTPNMAVFAEETFGPVAPVVRAANADQAIDLANQSRFGLGASLWTSNPERHAARIDRLEAGMIFVNGLVKSDPRLPFGGTKASGYGRELAAFGIREFVNVRTVWRGPEA